LFVASNDLAFLDTLLNFPEFEFQIQEVDGHLLIFDTLRKKYLKLTPEEWVRQHMIYYLVQVKAYPKSLFALEKGIRYNALQKRVDVLVLDRQGNPFLLIECKAPDVKLSQKTLEQVCMYNKTIQAPNIGITNGIFHLFFKNNPDSGKFEQIGNLPKFV
jgi:hypothetical protein